MKPGTIRASRLLAALTVVVVALALVSWDYRQSPGKSADRVFNDTTPRKESRERKVRDLDEAIAELDRVNIDAELTKAMEEVKASLKELDMSKIQLDVQNALKEVDLASIQKEVEKAMKEVDLVNIQKEVQESLKEIDAEKIQAEIKESMAKVDWEKMKTDLASMKDLKMEKLDIDLKEMKEELAKIGPEVEKSLKEAKGEIEKVKAQLKEYKSFVDDLDKEGLINKKENYSIEHRNGKLLINDKEASSKTYEKYRSFLEKHPTFSIEKDADDFDIDMD